jgi:hypothetical protein
MTQAQIAQRLIQAGVPPLDADEIAKQTNNVQDMYVIQRWLFEKWAIGGLRDAKREAVVGWWNTSSVPLKYKRLLTAEVVNG